MVERDGVVNHLLGTVHVGVSLHDLPDVVKQRLDASHTLIVEVDTDDMTSPEIMKQMVLPQGQSLRAMLGEHHWALLVRYLQGLYPTMVLDRLPPWIVHTALSFEDPTEMASGVSLDSQLVARARRKHKTMMYLETPQEQVDLLAKLIGVDDVRETLDDIEGARLSLKVLLRAYRNGNLAALTGLVLDPEEMAEDPEEIEALLFARNRRWMDTLVPTFARGGAFVAVGAAHHVGDDGLLPLLRKAGFTVTRVGADGHPVPRSSR